MVEYVNLLKGVQNREIARAQSGVRDVTWSEGGAFEIRLNASSHIAALFVTAAHGSSDTFNFRLFISNCICLTELTAVSDVACCLNVS